MLGDDIDDTFARFGEVAQRVFGVGVPACEADGEDWGVVIHDVGV